MIFIAVLFCLILAYLCFQASVFSISVAAFISALPILLFFSDIYFMVFLLVRPVVDIYSNYSIGGINLAALLTTLLILTCGFRIIKDLFLKKVKIDPLLSLVNKFFIVFLIASSLSFYNSSNRFISFADLIRLISLWTVFNYAYLFYSQKKQLERLVGIILVSAIIPLTFGFYQLIFQKGQEHFLGFNRIFGTFQHPNIFAQYLMLIFFVCLAFFNSKSRNIKNRAFSLICFSSIIILLIFTFTRSVLLSFVFSIICFFFVRSTLHQKLKTLFFVLFSALIAIPILSYRFLDLFQAEGGRKNSLLWRLDLWQSTIEYVKDHPVVGRGLAMYEYQIGVMAHNDYLRILYETGIFGLVSYVCLLVFLLLKAFNLARNSKDYDSFIKAKVVFSCLIALFIVSSVDNLARTTVVLVYYFSIAAAFLAYSYKNRHFGK